MVSISTVRPREGRRNRTPQHRFQVRQKPWQIQPIMIAPVLAGETMSNLLIQSRVVSHPVANPLVGWWAEYFVFYVKLRDLAYGQAGASLDEATMLHLEQMLIDPSYNITTDHNTAGASVPLYRYANTVDWVGLCLTRVVDEYFRDEGEAAGDHLIDMLPAAKIRVDNWMNSLIPGTQYGPVDVDIPMSDNSMAGDPHTHTLSAKEVNEALQRYQWDRLNNLTEMTFEEYIRTQGVRVAAVKPHVPELLRDIRDWTYPTNTVEPSSGSPSSALSWSIAERADKPRFFNEPGFIFAVSVMRPKVYLGPQQGAAVGLLQKATDWLPALLADDPFVSVKQIAQGTGPLPALTDAEGYWVDVRDLYIYGDQFVNFDVDGASARASAIALPTVAGDFKYPTEVMADALFRYQGASLGGDPEVFEPVLETIQQDGVMSLNIASRQVTVDHTARTVLPGS